MYYFHKSFGLITFTEKCEFKNGTFYDGYTDLIIGRYKTPDDCGSKVYLGGSNGALAKKDSWNEGLWKCYDADGTFSCNDSTSCDEYFQNDGTIEHCFFKGNLINCGLQVTHSFYTYEHQIE